MRSRVPMLARLAILALLPAAVPAAGQQVVDVRRRAAGDVSVRIAGTFASLRIIGTASDSMILTGTLPKEAKLENFSGGKGDDPIRGAKIYVDMPNDRSAASGALELRVPAGATVWAKAGTATIEAVGITGELDLNIVGGSILVASSPRTATIESMDGLVTIEGSPAWLRAKTAAGDITMRGSSEDAAFSSVSGSLRVGGGRFERARFEAVTGGIEFSGDPVQGGTLTFDTHAGNITLRLGAGSAADITATSITGSIENALTRQKPERGRDGRGQSLSAWIGGHGAQVTIRTFKGTIRLLSR